MPEFFHSIFAFDDPNVAVSATCGAIGQQGRPFCHGYEFHLDDATIEFELAAYSNGPNAAETISAKIIPTAGDQILLSGSDDDPVGAFVRQITEVRDAISMGRPSTVLDGQLARDAIAICEAQASSMVSQQPEKVAGSKPR